MFVLIFAIMSIVSLIVLHPIVIGTWQYYDAKRHDLDSPISWMSLTIIVGYASGLTLGLVPLFIYLIYYSDERSEKTDTEQPTESTPADEENNAKPCRDGETTGGMDSGEESEA